MYPLRKASKASLVCLSALLVLFAWGPRLLAGTELAAPHATTNRYEFRAQQDPDGIGKFYLGREIAQVMGHEAADWLERSERNEEEHSEQLVGELGLEPGQVLADIGAGTGYFSRRIARK